MTGVAFDVVDVDPRNGGNVDAERDALAEHGVTVLAEVRTPGVGAHFYVEASGRPKSNNQHGIDFQAAGGMVFVPPTIRPKYRGLGYAVIHARGLGDA
ncbi:MAG: bifunctional DNA primase/polymerase [Actinomycetes bacterium]